MICSVWDILASKDEGSDIKVANAGEQELIDDRSGDADLYMMHNQHLDDQH